MRSVAGERGQERRHLLLIVAAWVLVFLGNFDSLAIKSEDWTMLPSIAAMVRSGWRGLATLLLRPRIEFAPHLVEGALMRVFGLSPLPLFLFQLGAHGLSCLLLYRVLRRLSKDADLSVTAALCCLFVPTSASVVFYLTHIIFVFPVTMVLVVAHLYLYPLRSERLQLAALTTAALIGQLSGEQGIPYFYLLFLAAALRALRSKRLRRRHALRALVPPAMTAPLVAFLVWRISLPQLAASAAKPAHGRPLAVVLWQLAMFHWQSFDPTSWIFGHFSQAPAMRTLAGGALLAVMTARCYGRANPAGGETALPEAPPAWRWSAAAALLACIWWAPILLTTITGYRAGAMPKYIYGSGLCLAFVLVLFLDAAARRLRPSPARWRRYLFGGLVLYLGLLTQYVAHDVWGGQKRLDDHLWSLIDAGDRARPRFMILDGMAWGSSLVASYRSVAYSDFGANGDSVPNRLRETSAYTPIIVTRNLKVRRGPRGEPVLTLSTWTGRRFTASPRDVLAVVFRHGPLFGDLARGRVGVFQRLDEYIAFRLSEPRRFDGAPRHYLTESW